jgi:hypothetical protein
LSSKVVTFTIHLIFDSLATLHLTCLITAIFVLEFALCISNLTITKV